MTTRKWDVLLDYKRLDDAGQRQYVTLRTRQYLKSLTAQVTRLEAAIGDAESKRDSGRIIGGKGARYYDARITELRATIAAVEVKRSEAIATLHTLEVSEDE